MINYSPTSLAHSVDWNIKTFPVYRILDNMQWMKNFFENGEIQVSCFEVFRNYKDEMQGDDSEGTGTIVFNSSKSTHVFPYDSGLNAYILSTTKNLNDRVIKDFKGACAIKINHPTLFGMELAKKLPFVSAGLEGSCDYVASKIKFLAQHVDTDYLLKFLKEKKHPELNHAFKELTMGMDLFAKFLKYKHQSEYRLVWFGREKISSNYIAYCPELIDYCEPIEF